MKINNKFKNTKDYIFIASGIILLILLLGATVYSINFLMERTAEALGVNLQNQTDVPRINFEGLKKLGVIR